MEPTEEPDRFADHIDWTEAGLYNAEWKCELGRKRLVRYEYDTLSKSDICYRYFCPNTREGFRLVRLDDNISQWEAQCMAVKGTIFDRERIREDTDDAQPSMVDSDPYDYRGRSIVSAPTEKCN